MIRLENISKRYGSYQALRDIHMEIRRGETCVLLGPSGCGKSTTLRLINRLIAPDTGRILLDGQDIREVQPELLRRGMGYVIQSIGLLPHLSVEENISLVPSLLKWSADRKRARTEELLELVGLPAQQYGNKFPHQLSGGEAQRIGVARALAADPPVLLMDEPFGAVDPLNREQLQTEFLNLQRRLKKTVIFVTHDLEEAVRLGDRIAVMKDGEIRQYDTTPEILLHPADDFVRDFIGQDKALKLLSYYNVRYAMEEGAVLPGGMALSARCEIRPEESLKDALSLMLGEGVGLLPVRSGEGGVSGVVTLKAIVGLFLKEREQ